MKIKFLIDSGSAINVINLTAFQNLKKLNSNPYLKTTKNQFPHGQLENWL